MSFSYFHTVWISNTPVLDHSLKGEVFVLIRFEFSIIMVKAYIYLAIWNHFGFASGFFTVCWLATWVKLFILQKIDWSIRCADRNITTLHALWKFQILILLALFYLFKKFFMFENQSIDDCWVCKCADVTELIESIGGNTS